MCVCEIMRCNSIVWINPNVQGHMQWITLTRCMTTKMTLFVQNVTKTKSPNIPPKVLRSQNSFQHVLIPVNNDREYSKYRNWSNMVFRWSTWLNWPHRLFQRCFKFVSKMSPVTARKLILKMSLKCPRKNQYCLSNFTRKY